MAGRTTAPKRMAARYGGRCLAGRPQPGLAGCPKNGRIEIGDDIVWWKDDGRTMTVHQGGCEDVFWGNEFGRVEAEREANVPDPDMLWQLEEYAWEMRLGD